MKRLLIVLVITIIFTGCVAQSFVGRAESRIHVTILHFNDIYEITPISGGKEGGIARVATLRNQLLTRNPKTITTLGGDFFNPSAIGTALFNDDQLAGRQMVDVLNHFGLDYATFGNHEFDLKEAQFVRRIEEAQFTWVSSNVTAGNHQAFGGVRPYVVIPIHDQKSGKIFKIGLFGLTLPVANISYAHFSDPFQATDYAIKQLQAQVDFIIALTHQSIEDDIRLIEQYPQIGLVLGGHEHVNHQNWRGNFTPLLKGDANVRSVYVVDLYFDPETGKTEIKPNLVPIGDNLAEDPAIKAVVDRWIAMAFDAFRKQGFDPEAVVTITAEPLDGLESSVRYRSTNLTRLIAKSMLRAYPEAELAIYNSGSIRVDDVLPPGKISQYDVLRIMPFTGQVQLAAITGDLLIKVLEQGKTHPGSGGFLQAINVRQTDGEWYVGDKTIDPRRIYKLAINDYLARGDEKGFGFLKANAGFTIVNPGIDAAYETRKLVIDQLQNQ